MISTEIRNLMARFIIAAAACAGLHAMIVSPLRARSNEVRAELDEIVQQNESVAKIAVQLPDLLGGYERATREADQISERSRLALDESALFSRIMELSASSAVTVEQVVPQGDASPKAAAGASPPRPNDRAWRYSITGLGEYANVCDFVRDLEHSCGYTVLRNFRVAPDLGRGGNSSRFTAVVDVHAFDTSPVQTVARVGENSP